MLFDWNAVAAPGQVQDVQPCAPLTLTGDGLWVCLVSSGRCTASVPSAGPLPAGAALLLPPQSAASRSSAPACSTSPRPMEMHRAERGRSTACLLYTSDAADE